MGSEICGSEGQRSKVGRDPRHRFCTAKLDSLAPRRLLKLAGRSFDLLAEGVDVRCSLFHDVGTDASSKFGVFQNSVMVEGNLDLHRSARRALALWCGLGS